MKREQISLLNLGFVDPGGDDEESSGAQCALQLASYSLAFTFFYFFCMVKGESREIIDRCFQHPHSRG